MSNTPISLNELQILEHYQEMEKRFKRNTERPFFPSLDYFLDDKDNLSLLKTQVENMIHFVGLGSMPLVINVEKLQNAAAIGLIQFLWLWHMSWGIKYSLEVGFSSQALWT